MYVVFLDESGSPYNSFATYNSGYAKKVAKTTSGSFPPYPFFILAALGLQECHLPVVDDWFDGIKKSFLKAPDAVSGPHYEIKGSILYALRERKTPLEWAGMGRKRPYTEAQRDLWGQLKPFELEALERSIFDLLRRLAPVIWVIVVKQADLFRKHGTRTWPPYYWALTYIQQRVVQHIQATHGTYQQALFLMDETSTLRSATQFQSYLSVRNTINATARWPVNFGRYLMDVPVFGKSHLHQALQLADVTAHAVSRHVRKKDPLGWFKQVEPLLARHWTTGDSANAGLTYIT